MRGTKGFHPQVPPCETKLRKFQLSKRSDFLFKKKNDRVVRDIFFNKL
jgi:hypothetical protein